MQSLEEVIDNLNYGENLRITRQIKGISQEAMASALDISQATYSRIESGKMKPDRQQAAKIGEILGTPVTGAPPLLKDLDRGALGSTRGAGAAPGTAPALRAPVALVIKLAGALLIGNVGYEGARGACAAFDISGTTELIVRWVSAIGMMWCFYYWVRGIRMFN